MTQYPFPVHVHEVAEIIAVTAGSIRISIDSIFYTLMPGKSNYPYHRHFGKEEAFYIISGEAVLKTSKGEITVKEGDVILIPPNENGGHMLTNVTIDKHTYGPDGWEI